MAYEEALTVVSMEAGQDLSAKLYHFVTIATDGQVDPTGDGLIADGVLQNKPDTAGQAAAVGILGVSKVAAGGAVSIGDDVASDSAGKAVTATSGDEILGRALQEATASGDIIAVRLTQRGKALV